ncbi:MAG TPA: TRAP transporter small permease [Burkholderiaceae bacterium]|nr:TRAP transporter small permease [Burkholderiaceae bacterium]
MATLTGLFYRLLTILAGLAMVAAFAAVAVQIAARQLGLDMPGLDAYAGYAIAAALFLALPQTLKHGEHIRVTLLLQRLPAKVRSAFEFAALVAGLMLSSYVTFYAARLVWVSYTTHDISPGLDATPLWIPQLAMALGCFGFALAFADAIVARLRGRLFFRTAAAEAAHAE